jgi:hypothetical protein
MQDSDLGTSESQPLLLEGFGDLLDEPIGGIDVT